MRTDCRPTRPFLGQASFDVTFQTEESHPNIPSSELQEPGPKRGERAKEDKSGQKRTFGDIQALCMSTRILLAPTGTIELAAAARTGSGLCHGGAGAQSVVWSV